MATTLHSIPRLLLLLWLFSATAQGAEYLIEPRYNKQFKLSGWVLNWLEKQPNQDEAIEKALIDYYDLDKPTHSGLLDAYDEGLKDIIGFAKAQWPQITLKTTSYCQQPKDKPYNLGIKIGAVIVENSRKFLTTEEERATIIKMSFVADKMPDPESPKVAMQLQADCEARSIRKKIKD